MKNEELAKVILEKVGGKENVNSVTHCMTRLRFTLKNVDIAKQDELKTLDEIMGVVYKGGQFQLIIGPTVTDVYDEVVKMIPEVGNGAVEDALEKSNEPKEKGIGVVLNNVMGALAGCMTPLIPVLLCAGLSKTIVAVFGPQLLNIMPATSDLYILFTFVGDAGFYFMPVLIGYTAAKKFGCNEVMGILMGAILIHPTLIGLAAEGASFSVYGIPTLVQNYSSTVVPIILTVWIMSYVERWFKKYTPNVLKVVGIPFGTLLVMLPLALCVFGPLGAFIGNYVGAGIIGLYDMVGPLATAIVGATFSLLVLTGMHTVIFTFLFVTFPMVGFDAFVMPAILACSWAGAGVTIACYFKFKDTKKKQLTLSYFLTWLLGGVGEPMLYGLNIPYKTPLYAGVISGGIAGLLVGIIGLKAYVLNPSNGIYGLAAFAGGPNSNYILLAISVIASLVIGFVVMWFMKLDENINN